MRAVISVGASEIFLVGGGFLIEKILFTKAFAQLKAKVWFEFLLTSFQKLLKNLGGIDAPRAPYLIRFDWSC